jgi:WD40 repeat protein/tRNA A-37 threonylcarbamoyl transferase component Bud32
VPGYEVLEVLGRGGMGVVYKARHVALKRSVALKMIRTGAHAGTAELSRFRAEAEAVARLQHPNVVQIHEVGEHDGLPFLCLEYVDGGSLAGQLGGIPLTPARAAELVEVLARAMHAAHLKGVVHRDLKPHNVLLTAEGLPKVSDFGLAKDLTEAEGQTRTGAVLGTPSYMAPEQAEGKKEVGPAADVYALGAILYECLTGRPPFRAATPLETLEQVRDREPAAPRHLQPGVPRDLETVCLQCLQKQPHRRYASALELAEDLRRFLEGQPIRARPVSWAEAVWKWARRKPAVAGLLGGIVTVTLVALGLVTLFYLQALERAAGERDAKETAQREEGNARASLRREQAALGRERKAKLDALDKKTKAEEATRAKDAALEKTERALYLNQIARCRAEWSSGNAWRVESLLGECRFDLRGWEWHYLKRLCNDELLRLGGEFDPVSRVAFSPDGRRLAAAAGRPGLPQLLRLWDTTTWQLAGTVRLDKERVCDLEFSADGRRLALADESGMALVLDLTAGAAVAQVRGPFRRMACRPDGKVLALAATDAAVVLWDLAAKKVALRLPGKGPPVSCLTFSPDGSRLAAARPNDAGTASAIQVWDAATGKELENWQAHLGRVVGLAFSPDGRRLASAGADKTVKVWNARGGQLVYAGTGHTDPVSGVAFSADGRRLASASPLSLRLYDAATGREELVFRPGVADGNVALSPDGKRLATAGLLKVLDATRGQEAATLWRKAGRQPFRLAASPDGRTLALVSRLQGIGKWEVAVLEVATGRETRAFPLDALTVHTAAISPDGKRLASAAELFGEQTHGALVWDLPTGKEVLRLRGGFLAVAFRADGRLLTCDGGTVAVRDPVTGKQLSGFGITGRGRRVNYTRPAFSADGRLFAAQLLPAEGGNGALCVWEVATGKELAVLAEPSSAGAHGFCWLAFSRDGRHLATDTRVWDLTTRQAVLTPRRGGGERGMAFSPDGRRLASAVGELPSFRLFDAEGGQEVLTLTGHAGPVGGLAFSPDGETLFSAGGPLAGPGEVLAWDARPGPELLRTFAPASWRRPCFGADGKHLILNSLTGPRTLDLATGRSAVSPLLRGQGFGAATVSRDGARLAVASGEFVRVWQTAGAKEPLTIRVETVGEVALSPDGTRLAAAGLDTQAASIRAGLGFQPPRPNPAEKLIRVWDAGTGKLLHSFKGHGAPTVAVAFSPDGRRLASAGWDRAVKVWDLTTGKETLALAGHQGPVVSVAYHPDGKRLASGGLDGLVKVWDADTGKEILSLGSAGYRVTGVAYSPDGKLLVASGMTSPVGVNVRVWGALRGEELAVFSREEAGPAGVGFSPDGKLLALGCMDGVTAWDVARFLARYRVPPKPPAR